MKRAVYLICFLLMLATPMPSSAQVSGAQVNVTCPETVEVNDPVSMDTTTYQCTVSNPTSYEENISLEVESDGLGATTEAYVIVAAYSDESVDITVTWDNTTQTNSAHSVQLSATVQEHNGMPPPNVATSETSSVIDLDYDYASADCITQGSLTTEYIQLQMGDDWGDIVIQLNHAAAPVHANNFALLSTMGCYDNVIFHRVIDDFMIQAGDFTNGDGTGGHAAKWFGYCNGDDTVAEADCSPESYTIPDEADNGLLHEVCTISMAKTSQDNTGGSQFFLIPDDSNNGDGPSWLDGVHTVFGEVVHGCDVVKAISETETGQNDRPVTDVAIIQAVPSNVPHHDVDEDGVENDVDNCPNDANSDQADEDEDGFGDACDDPAADFDDDGLPDSTDPDDDNDGMNDEDDAFPYDASETTDTDGDGIGNNADADDDGDGVADEVDNCPYNNNEDQADDDNDGIGNACDAEDGETPAVPALSVVMTLTSILGALLLTRRD